MHRFKIEGTTLMSWSAQVEAESAAEAIELAQGLVGLMEEPADSLAVHTRHHRIRHCGLSASTPEPEPAAASGGDRPSIPS